MKTKKLLTFVIAIAATAVLANADVSLGTLFSGTSPTNPGPWATVSYADVSSGVVSVTLTTENMATGEFIGGFYFNVSSSTVPTLTITDHSGPTFSSSSGTNCCKADGDGNFDAFINYGTDVTNNTTSVIYVSGTGISAATMSTATSAQLANSIGSGTGFIAAIHLQGIPSSTAGQTCSGWIGDSGGTLGTPGAPDTGCSSSLVPEPRYTSLLLSSGLLGFAFLFGRRFKGQAS